DRGYIDDRTSLTMFAERSCGDFEAIPCTFEVNGDDLIEKILRHLPNGRIASDSSVVDPDVESAEVLSRRLSERLDFRKRCDITGQAHGGVYSAELFCCSEH